MKRMLPVLYSFMSQMLIVFSVTVLIVSTIGFFYGDKVGGFSTMLSLGNRGIAFSTIFQFLAAAALNSFLKLFFFSDKIIKNMMALWRTVLLVLSIIITTSGFIICFKWFPIDYLPAWILFLLSFGVCFMGGTLVMVIKNNIDSKKYDELLANYKIKLKDKEVKRSEGN